MPVRMTADVLAGGTSQTSAYWYDPKAALLVTLQAGAREFSVSSHLCLAEDTVADTASSLLHHSLQSHIACVRASVMYR